MTFKDKFKNYTIVCLVAIIAVMALLSQCGDGGTKTKETFLKGKETIKYDTIKGTDTIVEFKTKYYPKWDTVRKTDTTWNADLCNFERVYNDSTVDSNIVIHNRIETIGILKSINTSYKWKKPEIVKNISRTDTLIKPNKWSLYGYSEIGGNMNQFNASLGIDLAVKKVIVGYRYEAIQETHNIKVGISLFKSKK